MPAPLALGIKHGWESIAGPFLVTSAKGNLIQSINFEPAFPFYKEVIENHCNETVDFSDFLNIAKAFPFGMAQLDNEYLVRDPIKHHGHSIECAGIVPLNSMVYILISLPEKLIDSAAKASKDLKANLSSLYDQEEEYYTFTIDCISRAFFLGKNYPKELKAIKNHLPQKNPTVGLLTFGEIASSSQGVIRFLNKTTVIGGIKC